MLGPLTAYLGISLSRFYPSVSVARVFVLPNCCARWLNAGDLWVITLLLILTTVLVVSQGERPPSEEEKDIASSGFLVNDENSLGRAASWRVAGFCDQRYFYDHSDSQKKGLQA